MRLPIALLTDPSGHAIHAWAAALTYDSAVLRFVSAEATGTLSDGWSLSVNDRTAGQLRLSASSATPLSGSGALIQLTFAVIGAPGSRTDLRLSAFRLNAGALAATTSDGDLTVGAPAPGGSASDSRSAPPISAATLSGARAAALRALRGA